MPLKSFATGNDRIFPNGFAIPPQMTSRHFSSLASFPLTLGERASLYLENSHLPSEGRRSFKLAYQSRHCRVRSANWCDWNSNQVNYRKEDDEIYHSMCAMVYGCNPILENITIFLFLFLCLSDDKSNSCSLVKFWKIEKRWRGN